MNSNSQEEENLLLDFFEKIDKDIDVESNIRAVLSYSQNYSKFISKNGIKSILMTTKMNQDIHQGNIVRVKNWKEIYEEILKVENNL